MIKKTTGSRPATSRTKTGTALVSAKGAKRGALVRTDDGTGTGAVFKQDGVTLVVGGVYPMGDRDVVVDTAYYIGGDKAAKAADLGGADKVAWRDAATGYECIMIRDPRAGFLRGFVGVEPDHPLHGFDHDAVPLDLDIEVHGGLTYSAVCEGGPRPQPLLIQEAVRICHVPPRVGSLVNATDHRPAHDGAWWFGFDCNHVHDIVPGDRRDRERFLGHETGAVLRDEGYVYDQVVDLAAQLRAIADGEPRPPRTGASPPPLGLDPRRVG